MSVTMEGKKVYGLYHVYEEMNYDGEYGSEWTEQGEKLLSVMILDEREYGIQKDILDQIKPVVYDHLGDDTPLHCYKFVLKELPVCYTYMTSPMSMLNDGWKSTAILKFGASTDESWDPEFEPFPQKEHVL